MSVILDDSVFLAVAVANISKTSHVISLFPGLRENGAKYLQAVASANGYSMDRVEVTMKRNCQLTLQDTQQRKVWNWILRNFKTEQSICIIHI